MLRPAILAALLAATPAIAQPIPALPTRITIAAQFVDNGQADVNADLRTWSSLLAAQLANLLADKRYGLANAQYVTFAKPVFKNQMPTEDELGHSWTQMIAIQVIAGTGARSGNLTTFTGQIYLGSLKGDLSARWVPLNETISAGEYRLTRDVVTLATLYALAVDAGSTRSVACPLLARADQLRRDLATQHADVADLSAAVKLRLDHLNCAIVR